METTLQQDLSTNDVKQIGRTLHLVINQKEAKQILTQTITNAVSNEMIPDRDLIRQEIISFYNI